MLTRLAVVNNSDYFDKMKFISHPEALICNVYAKEFGVEVSGFAFQPTALFQVVSRCAFQGCFRIQVTGYRVTSCYTPDSYRDRVSEVSQDTSYRPAQQTNLYIIE